MDIFEWVEYGVNNGFCSKVVCATHDGIPTTYTEDSEWDEGGDPCAHVVRLLEDADMKAAIERNLQ